MFTEYFLMYANAEVLSVLLLKHNCPDMDMVCVSYLPLYGRIFLFPKFALIWTYLPVSVHFLRYFAWWAQFTGDVFFVCDICHFVTITKVSYIVTFFIEITLWLKSHELIYNVSDSCQEYCNLLAIFWVSIFAYFTVPNEDFPMRNSDNFPGESHLWQNLTVWQPN